MRTEPIIDYIVIVVPVEAEVDDDMFDELTVLAQQMILRQYRHPPRALLVEPVDWLITSDPIDVELHQPEHDCAACLAGNDQARAFLAEHPDRRLALGNLHYTEVWT